MPTGYSFADMADDYARVVAEEFDGTADAVLGMSTRGQIGFHLAAGHPGTFGYGVSGSAGYQDAKRDNDLLLRAPSVPSTRLRKSRAGAVICDTQPVNAVALLDRDAIVRACRRFAVARLRVFGSAVTDQFDTERSDLDFLVDFQPHVVDLLGNYLALNAELERITGRKVDLVMTDAVENPYFAAEASRGAQDLYAA